MNVKMIIVTQVIMTFLMALSMSGIMLYIAIGYGPQFLNAWMKQFILAWPIAFLMTNLMWPIANRSARALVREGAKDA